MVSWGYSIQHYCITDSIIFQKLFNFYNNFANIFYHINKLQNSFKYNKYY